MKKLLVWGMARSGIAAAQLLAQKGFDVVVNDIKTQTELGEEALKLNDARIEKRLGESVLNCLDGVDTLVISPGIPLDKPEISVIREKGISIISEIELAYRLGRGALIGITGTNGKTTTTTLMGEILKNAGKDAYVVGNIGDPYSGCVNKLTQDSVTVCELSSFQLETIDGFKPNISLILNLTEDHLNRHKTMENYSRIKQRVFINQKDNDCVILNYDDCLTRDMAKNVSCRRFWFSRTQEVDAGAYVRDGIIVFNDGNGNITELIPAKDVYIPGPHNLENALAAVAAAMCFGIDAKTIGETLKTFKGVEHRIETVRTVNGVTFINDSKGTNPDSTIKAVETMTGDTVIMLGGSEKNSDYSGMCAIIKNSNIKYAVLIGKTGPKIGEALKQAGFDAFEYAGSDFEAAIALAYKKAKTGWNVLLSPACASFDMFSDYEMRGREFKRIVGLLK